MTRFSPALRKLSLTAHVAISTGWLGAVLVFLALAIVGVNSTDPQIVRGAYRVMEPTAWAVLVPLAAASLISGIIQALGTPWGLVRHYWVIFKLALTAFITLVLMIYMETFRLMAARAADATVATEAVRDWSPVIHAALALLVLIGIVILAIYKPRGLTRHGWRKQHAARHEARPEAE